jgi:hypothetical protein
METAARQREELEREGTAELHAMISRLFDVIEESSESVRREARSVTLGPAQLTVDEGARHGRAEPEGPDFGHGWDVLANAYMNLRADFGGATSYRPREYTFCTTLAFARIPGDASYRWREVSFMEGFSHKPAHEQPIALNPFGREFSIALSNVVGRHQVACGPWTIDGEDEEVFQERWLRLFAKAVNRQLQPPSRLPLPESFFA